MEPLVSIVIPCYNQGQYIAEAVASALGQTYNNIEVIIINDGSTDNSDAIINNILEKHPDIVYLNVKNGGVSKARNTAIAHAKGSIILPLDADDTINEKYVELAVQEFIADPETHIVTANGQFFGNHTGEWLFPEFNMRDMLFRNLIFNTSFFKKEDWKKIGGYDENLKYAEDWEYFIRLSALKPEKVKRLNYVGLNYRLTGNGRNRTMEDENNRKTAFLYIYTKNKDLYFKYFNDPISLIKETELLKWEITKRDRELNFLKRFFPNKLLLNLRNKKHSK